MKWFEATVTFVEGEGGKKVKETYLVDAMTFTEAEARVTEYVAGTGVPDVELLTRTGAKQMSLDLLSKEFECMVIKRVSIADIIRDMEHQDWDWYQTKVQYITVDEFGQEKRTSQNIMVQSNGVMAAISELNLFMRGTISDWECVKVEKTKIAKALIYETKDAE